MWRALFLALSAILSIVIMVEPGCRPDRRLAYVTLYHEGKKLRQWSTCEWTGGNGFVDFREVGEDHRTFVTGNVVVELAEDAFLYDHPDINH